MSFFEERERMLKASTETQQLPYKKRAHAATGEGERYEECSVALVLLRCLRRGAQFLLSSNDEAAGRFDDVVLCWSEGGRPVSALFVQLKHKEAGQKTIRTSHLKSHKSDFCIMKYHESYKNIKGNLGGDRYALVLSTNADLTEDAKKMFSKYSPESVPGMELLESGGCLYSLNQDNDYVKSAFQGEDGFVQHFYLFCNQCSTKTIKSHIIAELQLLLGADETYCAAACDGLCGRVREWMNTEEVCLTSRWKSWLDIVDRYIKAEVSMCNSVVTRIKFSSVAALRAHIEARKAAWIRPPGPAATALTATRAHQAVCGESHVVVSAARLTALHQEKLLSCWGRFCRWLVLVDDAEGSCDIQHHMMKHVGPERHLIIVSHERDYSFLDTFKSDDICDDTWKALINVETRLNSDQYSCRLGDLCDTEALKTMLDENPEALAALSQLTGPVRMGQDLDPLPNNHIDRRLISRMHVREEFFSILGVYDMCIMDKLSYNHLTNVPVNTTVKFEELENYLCASNTLWPLFGITDNIELPVIKMICSKLQNTCVYVLSYEEDGWEILFLHSGSAKILPYVKEQSISLWQIVDSLSRRIIVDGKPGIGKSTFLLDIASQVKCKNPSWWILRINLLTYSEVFNSSSSSFEAVNKILLRVVYNEKNLGILEHSLLLHCLKNYPHIICLVDGFDEICPDYAEKCLQALQQLAPRQGKLVVATRPSVTDCLEAAMGVLAHSLPAFTEEEVHRFHQGGKLGVTDVVVELLKIPLFSRMYAEALDSGIMVDDIMNLYETFFERKFRRLYGEKWGDDLSKPGKKTLFETERKKQENHLGFLAVSHLLPKLVLSAAQTSSINRDDLVRAGIIYQFIDDKPIFIHRTFAEHFLAKWCLSQVDKCDCAKVYQTALSDNSLEFFVESFDRMASRGRPLLTAVLNGSESEVDSLLQRGADPAERDEVGRNSLHLAAAYSHLSIHSTLLWLLVRRLEVAAAERVGGSAPGPAEETREAVNEVVVCEMDEKTRLADKERTPQCVQVTSDLGLAEASGTAGLWAVAAPDAVSAALGAEDALLQWTPLRYAAERRRWGAVEALLEAGAQPRHLGDFQRGLLHPQQLWRVFKEKGFEALVKHVKSENGWWNSQIQGAVSIVCAEMSPQQYKEICPEALRSGHWEVAMVLHLKIVEMQNKSTTTGCPELQLNQGTRLKPRHEAGLGICKKLKEKQMGSTEERQTPAEDDPRGWTELQRAVAAGDVAGVRRLLEAGVDVDMQDNWGWTAMHLAAEAGCVDCMKVLLSAGAAVNIKEQPGFTALHWAAYLGRRQAVRLLLAAGADAGAQDSAGSTPLHMAAMRGNAECLRLMVPVVRNLELKDVGGCTALHEAAQMGYVASVRLLLAAGADSNAVNDGLWTALHWAACRSDTESVRLLLRAGAAVAAKDKRGATALHWAAQRHSPDCVRLLLDAAAGVQEKDDKGITPLHWAAGYGSRVSIRLLLQEGADVHQRNSSGETPLHWAAAQEGKAECVRLLLEAGANIQEKNQKGDTPLHWAARAATPACIRLLLQEGADVHQSNRWAETPLHRAVWRGVAECVRLLLEAGADALAQDAVCRTPLQVAAVYKNEACIALLNGAVAHRQPTAT